MLSNPIYINNRHTILFGCLCIVLFIGPRCYSANPIKGPWKMLYSNVVWWWIDYCKCLQELKRLMNSYTISYRVKVGRVFRFNRFWTQKVLWKIQFQSFGFLDFRFRNRYNYFWISFLSKKTLQQKDSDRWLAFNFKPQQF